MIPTQLPPFAFARRLLGSVAVSCCLLVPIARAQDSREANSHVLLEMPGASGADNVLMQYRMLQRLQQMASSSSEDSPINVEQLLKGMPAEDQKALIELAQKNLQPNLLGDGTKFEMPTNSSLPGELRQLADRFGQSQGGQTPEETPRSSGPELRQRSTPRTGTTIPSTTPRTGRPSTSSPRPEQNAGRERPNELRPRTQSQGGQVPRDQAQNSSERPNPPRPAGQQPSGDPSAQALETLRRLAEQNPEVAKQFVRSLANRRNTSSQNSSAGPQSGMPGGTDSTPGFDASSLQELLGGSGDTSMQDLLRQMASNPSQLPPIEDLAGTAGAAKDTAGGYAQPLSQQLKSMVDGDLARKVERTGLGRTLSGLLKEARKAPAPKTDPSSTSGNPSDSGNQSLTSSLEKSVLTTLDGFGKSLLGNKDKKKEQAATPGSKATSGNKQTDTSTGQPKSAGKKNDSAKPAEESKPGFFKSATKAASKAIDGWVSGNSQPQSPQSAQKDTGPSSAAKADASAVGNLPDATGFGGLLWAALGLTVLAVVLWFAFRNRFKTLLGEDSQLPFPAEALRRIKTHADVIAAFHAIAYRSSGHTQPWWTHRRAVDELARKDSAIRSAWERLAGLYEESRYMQGGQALSPEQAQRAEQAIQTLAQAPANA